MKVNKIESTFEAYCVAIQLAITAPNDAKSKECIDMANTFSRGLSELEIARARKRVEKRLGL